MSQKIVINACHGGFGLSNKAKDLYFKYKQWSVLPIDNHYISLDYIVERNDPELLKVIKELGEKAGSLYATLKIVEIPDEVEWEIQEYGGKEWIAEKHRIWT